MCGVPNGDGTTCLSTDSDFYVCEEASDGSQNAKQAIVRSHTGGFSGLFRLAFNGEVTPYMSVLASTDEIQNALENLETVGTLKVSMNITYTSSTQLSAMDIFIEFSREDGIYPSHYGSCPFLLDSSSLSGLTYQDVAHVCSEISNVVLLEGN